MGRQRKAARVALVVLGTILAASVVALAFLLGIQGVALNIDLWQEQWERLGIDDETNMTRDDLLRAARALVSYFQGEIESPQITVVIDGRERPLYGWREILHLADVRELYCKGIFLRNKLYVIAPSLAGLAFALWWMTDSGRQLRPSSGRGRSPVNGREKAATVLDSLRDFVRFYLARVALLAGVAVLVLALLLAVPAVLDFSDWWTAFHRLSFSNDLWLLDPSKEWLVKMFPLEFFFAVTAVLWRRLVLGGLLLTLAGGLGARILMPANKPLRRPPRS
ncbi:MAG: DUF1461 domain-containing protein [Firmicutes bacterium]|nr:DUF1461 domain-containing protein [Candidatus Fermentithermobacillaceae bacterium]